MNGQKSAHGHAYCLCMYCASSSGARKFVKKLRRRELRIESNKLVKEAKKDQNGNS